MPQKPLDFQPLDIQPIDINQGLDIQPIQQNKGLLQQWDESWINQPLSHLVTGGPVGPKVSSFIDPIEGRTEDQWRMPEWIPFIGGGTYRSLIGGMGEGATNVAEGLTTPLNLATAGTAGVASRAAKTARTLPALSEAAYTTAPKVAAMARRATQGLGAPMIASGAARAITGENPGDFGFGIAEMAGGAAATMMPKNFPAPRGLEKVADARTQPMPDLPLNLEPPTSQPLPHRITLRQPTPAAVADLRNKGYVSGGVDESGYPVMIRKDVLDKIEAPPMPQRPEPVSSSIFGENEINFDEEITIKNPSAAAIKKLQDQGFTLAEVDGNIAIFRPISEQEMRVPGPEDYLPPKPTQPEPTAPHLNEFAPDMMQIDESVMGGYSPKFVPRTGALERIGEPQEMRVPGWQEGNAGLENIALGPKIEGNTRLLDAVATKLYSKEGPVTAAKELIQNADDEHAITGKNEPIRIVTNRQLNPRTNEENRTITIRDRGRGLTPEQLYKQFTDVGESGKTNEVAASGGFGFAKAAPLAGGKFVKIRSVVDMPEGRMEYTFEGTGDEIRNQARGVPLNARPVGPEVPTGLQVTTYYPKDAPGFYQVSQFAEMSGKFSKSGSPIEYYEASVGKDINKIQKWLDSEVGTTAPGYANIYEKQPLPPLQDTIYTPGASVNIHYAEPEKGYQSSSSPIHMLNKGLYQTSDSAYYGDAPVPNVPKSIVADIIATVDETHADYPYTLNREQLDAKVSAAIDKWVEENITSGARKKRVQELQRKYDSIATFGPESDMYFLDEGARLTPDEIQMMNDSQVLTAINNRLLDINEAILTVADTLGWSVTPSSRLKKFGLLFQAPDKNGTTLGIHIPRPDDLNDSAILINLFEHVKRATGEAEPLDKLSTGLLTTITHEQAHIPGGGHDTSFAYRHAQLMEALGRRKTNELLDSLAEVFDDGTGGINPELSDFLSVYAESRLRPARENDAILATGVHSRRPTNRTGGKESNVGGAIESGDEPSTLRELYELPRGLTTTADLSFGFRQGLPLITTKQWWTSWGEAVKAMGSDAAYKEVMAKIESDPIMQRRVDTTTGKIKKSFAQEAGLALTDLSKKLNNREESQRSTLAERLPLGIGKVVRGSNRAYNAYLNQLRFETFKSLLDDARNMSVEGAAQGEIQHPGVTGWFGNKMQVDAQKAAELNPYRNLVLARQIADFVNTGTGRGPLRLDLPTIEKGRLGMKERSLEQAADVLTNTLFSPRLFASRVRMLNPGTYVMADPFVRKQYVKALLSTAAAWSTVSSLAAMSGASVSLDPTSSDFGKIKIGDTRLDPAGGFQQFLVAASRFITGEYTSSAHPERGPQELGQGFRAETRKDVTERFMVNKLHPVARFAYDLLFASKYQPVGIGDRITQMFIPLIIQDVIEIAKSDPTLLPLIGPVAAGMGTQTYEQGEQEGKIVPPEMDWMWTGGTPRRAWDALIGNENEF